MDEWVTHSHAPAATVKLWVCEKGGWEKKRCRRKGREKEGTSVREKHEDILECFGIIQTQGYRITAVLSDREKEQE